MGCETKIFSQFMNFFRGAFLLISNCVIFSKKHMGKRDIGMNVSEENLIGHLGYFGSEGLDKAIIYSCFSKERLLLFWRCDTRCGIVTDEDVCGMIGKG